MCALSWRWGSQQEIDFNHKTNLHVRAAHISMFVPFQTGIATVFASSTCSYDVERNGASEWIRVINKIIKESTRVFFVESATSCIRYIGPRSAFLCAAFEHEREWIGWRGFRLLEGFPTPIGGVSSVVGSDLAFSCSRHLVFPLCCAFGSANEPGVNYIFSNSCHDKGPANRLQSSGN